MHEFAICRGLVETVLAEIAERRIAPGTVEEVTIAAGALHQIVPDSLSFYYDLLTRDTPAAGSRLVIRPVALSARCRECRWEGRLDLPVFRCGACHGAAVEVIAGRELLIESIRIADDL